MKGLGKKVSRRIADEMLSAPSIPVSHWSFSTGGFPEGTRT